VAESWRPSVSTMATVRPDRRAATAQLMAVVVFPVPPFSLSMAMLRTLIRPEYTIISMLQITLQHRCCFPLELRVRQKPQSLAQVCKKLQVAVVGLVRVSALSWLSMAGTGMQEVSNLGGLVDVSAIRAGRQGPANWRQWSILWCMCQIWHLTCNVRGQDETKQQRREIDHDIRTNYAFVGAGQGLSR
jgi:hypothetical protein